MKKIEKFKTLNCYGLLVNRADFPGEELIYKDGNYYLPVNDSVEMDAVTCNITYVSTEPLDFDNLESIVEKPVRGVSQSPLFQKEWKYPLSTI